MLKPQHKIVSRMLGDPLAPKSMRVMNRMHFAEMPSLRNKGFLELHGEANTLGISIEEVISRYERGLLP